MWQELILERLAGVCARLSIEHSARFVAAVKDAPRIYVSGAGRSGLVAKAFAMRLVHLNLKVFVVGDTVTPAMRAGDVLVAVSGSGETASTVSEARVAKELGGRVLAVTASADSSLARLAEVVVEVPAQAKRRRTEDYELRRLKGPEEVLTPLGSLFELSALIFFESCVVELMRQLGVAEEDMARLHANI
jgi:6-phospho 3-hexuloisomerase